MADKKELPLALIEILTKYTDQDHLLSTPQIISILESEYGLTCERRTIYANMELLKQYGYKVSTWHENSQGYYLTEHQFTDKEMQVLLELIKDTDMLTVREKRTLKQKLSRTMKI